MNFSCPNQVDGHCEKLEKPCHPVQEGCVLEGKVKLMGEQEQPEEHEEDGFAVHSPPFRVGDSRTGGEEETE